MLFARQLSFFIVTVYVPCSMTVSVSWMSFWLDHKAVSCPGPGDINTIIIINIPLWAWHSGGQYDIIWFSILTHNLPGSRPGGSRGDDSAGDVHHPGQHPELPAPGGLHQGYRCLVRGLRLLRVRGPPGVRDGQLCLKVCPCFVCSPK